MQPRERIAFSPIETRPKLTFPDGVRMVIWPVLALEDWDISRAMARMVIVPPQLQPLLPDHPNWSWHEYGMRVGFWRMRKMLERVGATPTVTLNAKVCESYPEVVEACSEIGLGAERARLRADPDAQARRPARDHQQGDGRDRKVFAASGRAAGSVPA